MIALCGKKRDRIRIMFCVVEQSTPEQMFHKTLGHVSLKWMCWLCSWAQCVDLSYFCDERSIPRDALMIFRPRTAEIKATFCPAEPMFVRKVATFTVRLVVRGESEKSRGEHVSRGLHFM